MLSLPGKVLDISALNSQHKFRDRGKKQGAVDAIQHLEEAGLGVVHKERATRGTALVSVTCFANMMYIRTMYALGGQRSLLKVQY